MNIADFKRIVASFADDASDLATDKKELLVKVRDELIEISVVQQGLDLLVIENSERFQANVWIVNRLAKLPQLAGRIIDYIEAESNFICPHCAILEDIEKNPDDSEQFYADAAEAIINSIDSRNALSTSVMYVTSDAGEGKTTLINELARRQAQKFKDKKSFWLLVPIPLGGRPFLRFDDIVIASIVNRLRFPMFYYESFLELVKLGVIVPAFDGFEEMFMESSTGEALSALGQLMNRLESSGAVVIAARKAYFDYKNFSVQSKLFDTIESHFVSFSRVSLKRWDMKQFVEYARQRQISEPASAYEVLSGALGTEHPIITRAVLVKQLLDVFKNQTDFMDLARKIASGTAESYFSNFVEALLDREANTKWIDRSGEPARPLLTIDEHNQLLSLIAQEMWMSNTDALGADVLDLIADFFAESKKLGPTSHRQTKERIKQHALIVKSQGARNAFCFDHEEFRQYFLGLAVAQRILDGEHSTMTTLLRIGVFPQQTIQAIVQTLRTHSYSVKQMTELSNVMCKGEGTVSFVRENLGAIAIRVLAGYSLAGDTVRGLIFPVDSLSSIELIDAEFIDCYFQGTSVENSKLTNCTFVDCTFDRLELHKTTTISNVTLKGSNVRCVHDGKNENTYYDPKHITQALCSYLFDIFADQTCQTAPLVMEKQEEELIMTERVVRRFLKSTCINEGVFKIKLGKMYSSFEDRVLPALLHGGVLVEVHYEGGGIQRRFKLGKPMTRIEEALTASNGKFENFLLNMSQKP